MRGVSNDSCKMYSTWSTIVESGWLSSDVISTFHFLQAGSVGAGFFLVLTATFDEEILTRFSTFYNAVSKKVKFSPFSPSFMFSYHQPRVWLVYTDFKICTNMSCRFQARGDRWRGSCYRRVFAYYYYLLILQIERLTVIEKPTIDRLYV